MKITKHFLVLVILTGVLCGPAFGEIEHGGGSVLLYQPNPTLVGIDNLHVTIIHPDEEPNGLKWGKLREEIDNNINEAGMKVFTPEPGVKYKLPIWPALKIHVDMLGLGQSEQYVFRIQTSLSRAVFLTEKQKFSFKADVWKTDASMQAVSVADMPAAVTKVVLEQTEAFIMAWLTANPQGIQTADVNDIDSLKKEREMPLAKSPTAKDQYVASKNSKVFHRPDCGSAKRISPKNLVGYNSRDEVIQAGKRPCKRCKP